MAIVLTGVRRKVVYVAVYETIAFACGTLGCRPACQHGAMPPLRATVSLPLRVDYFSLQICEEFFCLPYRVKMTNKSFHKAIVIFRRYALAKTGCRHIGLLWDTGL